MTSMMSLVRIVDFPSFFSGNIPSWPSYGVYISQLIKCASQMSPLDAVRKTTTVTGLSSEATGNFVRSSIRHMRISI